MVIESAALAAFMQIVEMAFYFSDFPGVYFVADSTAQIVVSQACPSFLSAKTEDGFEHRP